MFKTLALVLTLVVSTGFAQVQTKYLMLGTYQGISYESELSPKETAKTRNTIIAGDGKGYYVIKDWSYDCPSKTIKELHRALYSPDNILLKEEDVKPSEWLKTEDGSFGRQALKYWCADVY